MALLCHVQEERKSILRSIPTSKSLSHAHPQAVQFALFAISTGNSISFSSYLLRAATLNAQDGSWLNRGISIAAVTVVCLIHSFAPRWGIWLSNGFGAFKLVLLSLVVCTGFAALAGRTAAPRPDNFSKFPGARLVENRRRLFGRGRGRLLACSAPGAVILRRVLTEVRNAPKTLRRAALIADSAVTVLYVLASVSYFAAMSKEEIANSRVVVAAQFFRNVWGESVFMTRVVPFFISLSAPGNVFAQSFAMPRVKQELAKESVLPWARFWASNWPFNAPSGAIFLHWISTCALILGSHTTDVYSSSLPGWFTSTLRPSERWAEQRTTFRNSPLLTIFWIVSLLFVQAPPFIKNDFFEHVPFYVVPTLGTSLLVIGTAYWLVWAKVLPALGYQIQHEIVQIPDGTERVKYKRVKPKKRRRQGQWTRQRKLSVWFTGQSDHRAPLNDP
ncbi:hypothetical protein N657DRAFT_672263 [Parathielavia appendiculata]|uniref:Uncharacterized protein n=1 Tax=Parathielavia appendiculata TaxID=2587402 RepID=A0AAN6Z2V7_9PEZI|nr:hypothetical protein N657DRAFT_672263 [Parathielavia appendiculata]